MSETKRNGKLAVVTGGGGFIASNVARGLLKKGYQVRVIDNLSGCGSWYRLEDLGDQIDRVETSIGDTARVEKALDGASIVYHLAAAVSVPESVANPIHYHETDATGTLKLLEACRTRGVNRFVYASTSAAYGEAPEQPKRESQRTVPISPYGVAKLAGEMYVTAYAKLHGMKNVSLRYFNVFGPGQNPRSQYGAAVPSIVSKIANDERPTIYGDGEQTRDFCYIDNIVHANMLAGEADVLGEALNIGCGLRVTVNAIVGEANRVLGKHVKPIYEPPRPGDVRDSLADISLAKQVIGYEPLVQFAEGMSKAIPWYCDWVAKEAKRA